MVEREKFRIICALHWRLPNEDRTTQLPSSRKALTGQSRRPTEVAELFTWFVRNGWIGWTPEERSLLTDPELNEIEMGSFQGFY